jgi:hypothetical protein
MTDRTALPTRRASETIAFSHAGRPYRATFSKVSGRIVEVFLDTGKPDSEIQTHASDAAILASLLLQHGVDIKAIRHSIAGPLASAIDVIEGAVYDSHPQNQ